MVLMLTMTKVDEMVKTTSAKLVSNASPQYWHTFKGHYASMRHMQMVEHCNALTHQAVMRLLRDVREIAQTAHNNKMLENTVALCAHIYKIAEKSPCKRQS
jgi:hypothetical protein